MANATRAQGLGPLEMKVLGILGAEPRELLAVAVVCERLRSTGVDLAYTTIMTVLVRLHRKGLVERHRDGNRYRYGISRKAPRVTEGILARVGRTLFEREPTKPILALLDDSDLSRDDLRALRRAIDAKLKGTKS